MILLSPLSGLSVPHFTARANPIGGAIICLKSIFRNGPNLLSFAIETKIQNPLTSNRRHTPKGRETPKQSQQNREKGKTREISPRDPGFKSQRARHFYPVSFFKVPLPMLSSSILNVSGSSFLNIAFNASQSSSLTNLRMSFLADSRCFWSNSLSLYATPAN